jgi:beta-lactamase class D
MNRVALIFILCGLFLSANTFAEVDTEVRSDWQTIFDNYASQGTIVVMDLRKGESKLMVFNEPRSQQRLPPASTFKIPHALFALDAGIVKDEFQLFPWDGVERSFAQHNQDQDLRSSMRNSAVWVYEQFGEKIGLDKARDYLTTIDYGNADPTGDTRAYWIDGNLRITAQEQIGFLKKLYLNELPFDEADQRLVKDIMIVEAGKEWILRAKTGWEGQIGWWVGWVEWPTGPVFFALNIDTPNRLEDLHKREAITRKVLQSIEALPKSDSTDK